MKTLIYLIRHGEVHNPEGILYGRLPNFRLSERGEKQIENTAKFLKDKQIDELYASPLQRARETAEIIQKGLGLPTIHFDEQILEVKTAYEGIKFNELDSLQSEIYLKPLDPSDETIGQIAHRMLKFVEKLVDQYKGKHIALVSHGDPIMALKTIIEKRPLEFSIFKQNIYVKHGEVYQITAEGENLSIKSVFIPITNA